MPSILVVEQEERYVERINGALSAEGWRVRVVPQADQAIQAAASDAPDLVMVSAEVPGAETLASSFSRSSGGPGVVALLPENGAGAMAADDLLAKPFTDDELRATARRALEARRPAPPVAAAAADHKLTSQDIFGDVLAEVEGGLAALAGPPAATAPPLRPAAATKPARPAADDEIQRRLEKTLSGMLLGTATKPRRPAAPPRRPPADDDNVDALLSRTLSDLDLGRTKTGVRPPAPAAAAPPAPEPAAPSPAVVPPVATAAAPPAPAAPAPPAAARESTAARRRPGDFDFSELEELARPFRPAPAKPAPVAAPAAAAPPARPAPPPAAAPETLLFEPLPDLPEPSPLPDLPEPPPLPDLPEPFDAHATQRIPLLPDETGEQPGERFGQYTLLERIAAGGMAEVWKARMRGVEGFQKTVAIKRILPHMTDNTDFIGMFIDEAKLAAHLTHPNIVHIYDLGKIGRDYYIAMEYVEGKDLRSLLNAGRNKGMPLPLELGLMIAARLASALDYAHRKRDFEDREMGLVHRDVSPQNVLLTYEGDVKLCDFGIAKAVSKVSQTQMGALKGKLQYMSPEQAWGRPVDGRSDLFSLGSVLFEMITGERLFPGESEMSVLDAVRQGKTRSPRQVNPAIPQEVDEIVTRALAVDPGDRFQSADEMKRRLGQAISALAPSVGPTDLAAYIQRVLEPGAAARSEDAAAPAPITASRAAAPATTEPAPAGPEPPAGTPATVEAVAPLVEVKVDEVGGRKSRTLLYAAIAALVVIAVVTFFLLSRRPAAAPPGSPPPAGTATPAPAVPAPVPQAAPGQTAPQAAPGAPIAAQVPPDIKAAADKLLAAKEEDLRRQNEERLKALEQQVADAKKTPEKPAAATPAPPAAADTAPAQTAQTPAPRPAEPAAATPAPQPEPEPVQAQAPPAAPPREPEPPRVKLGDLAEPGAGVVPPQLVSSPKPEYPPMARTLRVEGVVVVSVLVDENGQVKQVRMEEPIAQKVGINEAALATARSARFKPATKDGVRVKMWTRLKIPFKL